MHKRILIPIDFHVESLNTLKLALEQNSSGTVNVTLMYAEYLSGSITDLLFYSSSEIISSLNNPEFEEAISILNNKYPRVITGIRIELFHGFLYNAFKNFTNAHRIDEIYVPKSYALKIKRKGFDPMPLIRKSPLPVREMHWENNGTGHGHLPDLFNN